MKNKIASNLMFEAAEFAKQNINGHPSLFEELLLRKYTELLVKECALIALNGAYPVDYTHTALQENIYSDILKLFDIE